LAISPGTYTGISVAERRSRSRLICMRESEMDRIEFFRRQVERFVHLAKTSDRQIRNELLDMAADYHEMLTDSAHDHANVATQSSASTSR